MLLENKVAVITGSGRGIGRAITKLFAREGASVFLTARTEGQVAGVAKEILAEGGNAGYAAADLMREKQCEHVIEAARAQFGRVDILVNNAGHYGPVVPVEEYPLEEFDKVIAVHLRAAFVLSKLVLPEMYARNSGVILNISSLSAKSAFSWGSAYAAAKAGMLGLRDGGGSSAARGARKRDMPGTRDRDEDEQGTGKDAGGKAGSESGRTTERIFELAAARKRADGDGNRAGGAVFVLGHVERDGGTVDQRGRRGGVFLTAVSGNHF
jgi:short chain dehydrogenase